MDAARRSKTFDEATIGLTPVEAMEETCRCLRCDVRNGE
jgi:NADPH-dependent glutamate synthase beta subunit-like oxidoreductase